MSESVRERGRVPGLDPDHFPPAPMDPELAALLQVRDKLFPEMVATLDPDQVARATQLWAEQAELNREINDAERVQRELDAPAQLGLSAADLERRILRQQVLPVLLANLRARKAAHDPLVNEAIALVRWELQSPAGSARKVISVIEAENKRMRQEIEEREKAISRNDRLIDLLRSEGGSWTPPLVALPGSRPPLPPEPTPVGPPKRGWFR